MSENSNSGLSQLKLDCNNFTEDGLLILTGFIHLCPCLKFLSSRCCQLTSADLNALLTELSKGGVHDNLTTWCLVNCNIGDDGVSDLIEHVHSIFPNLTDIHLDGNPASAEVKSRLKEILDVKTNQKDKALHDQVEADGALPDQSTQLQG